MITRLPFPKAGGIIRPLLLLDHPEALVLGGHLMEDRHELDKYGSKIIYFGRIPFIPFITVQKFLYFVRDS